MSKSVIITCAVTGGIHTPTMSPHLPVKPADIAQAAIEAAEVVVVVTISEVDQVVQQMRDNQTVSVVWVRGLDPTEPAP